jgi:hypothetical protein
MSIAYKKIFHPKRKKGENVVGQQGDLIGRIFAYRAFIYFGQFFLISRFDHVFNSEISFVSMLQN